MILFCVTIQNKGCQFKKKTSMYIKFIWAMGIQNYTSSWYPTYPKYGLSKYNSTNNISWKLTIFIEIFIVVIIVIILWIPLWFLVIFVLALLFQIKISPILTPPWWKADGEKTKYDCTVQHSNCDWAMWL